MDSYPTTLAVLCAVLLLSTSASAFDAPTAWDLVEEYGLPRGLVPSSVSSYSLRESDNFFTMTLHSPCYVQFADLVYYDTKITGYLSYGSIKEINGIQVKKFFVWLPITALEVDSTKQQVEFKVGLVSQNYPITDFETVKKCQKNGLFSSSGPCGVGSSCRGVGSFYVPDLLAVSVREVN